MQEAEQKESEKKGRGDIKFEAEIMGRNHTSIPVMRRQPWKANQETRKFEKKWATAGISLRKSRTFS